jgi:hypothetical protein
MTPPQNSADFANNYPASMLVVSAMRVTSVIAEATPPAGLTEFESLRITYPRLAAQDKRGETVLGKSPQF